MSKTQHHTNTSTSYNKTNTHTALQTKRKLEQINPVSYTHLDVYKRQHPHTNTYTHTLTLKSAHAHFVYFMTGARPYTHPHTNIHNVYNYQMFIIIMFIFINNRL